jgi:hypothetical protein
MSSFVTPWKNNEHVFEDLKMIKVTFTMRKTRKQTDFTKMGIFRG